MARKLKVFVTPAGFPHAYVAAPGRTAALAAWGSDADLFARGAAQEVTDVALMAEPLARPDKVVKRSRGTAAEQLAAAPAPVRRNAAATTVTRPEPKPDRANLGAAEATVADMARRHRAARRDIAERQAAIDREKRALATERAEATYDAAMRAWRL